MLTQFNSFLATLKNRKLILILIISPFIFSAVLFTHSDNPTKVNDECIQYYLKTKSTLLQKGKLEWKKIDYRRLRFGGMLYCIREDLNSLSTNSKSFLVGEKQEFKDKIAAADTQQASILAKSILEEEITYLPALKFYSQLNTISRREKEVFQSLFAQIESSLLKSGDGKSIQTAYEILNNDEIDFLLGSRCEASIAQSIERNGRVFSIVNCGRTPSDSNRTYFDITSISIMKLSPVGLSFSDELNKQNKLIYKAIKKASKRSQVFSESFIPSQSKAIADSMASQFIRLYKESKWDSLWDCYKEKSIYYNPVEQNEKNKFFTYIRAIYDTCGIFKSAELSSFNVFKFGMALNKGLEYQYNSKYENCEKTLFLEIWTVGDSVTNFMHFGFSRREDE